MYKECTFLNVNPLQLLYSGHLTEMHDNSLNRYNDNYWICYRGMGHFDIKTRFYKLPKISNGFKCKIFSMSKLKNKLFKPFIVKDLHLKMHILYTLNYVATMIT